MRDHQWVETNAESSLNSGLFGITEQTANDDFQIALTQSNQISVYYHNLLFSTITPSGLASISVTLNTSINKTALHGTITLQVKTFSTGLFVKFLHYRINAA